MTVKCINVSIPGASPYLINSDMQEYLKIGIDHEVYGLRIAEEASYYMIFHDEHLVEVPTQLFEIVDSRVCPLWVVRCARKKEITFWPELFYKDDFFENFSEYEKVERKEFDDLRRLFDLYKKILI